LNGTCLADGNEYSCSACDDGYTLASDNMSCIEDINCSYTEWADSDTCSCETSTKTQTRDVSAPAQGSGTCLEALSQTVSCTPDCDCQYGEWTDVGVCSCENNLQNQSRTKTRDESGSGTCDNVLTQQVLCIPDCDCEYSQWADQGECSCETSLQSQTRTKTRDESGSGTCDDVLSQTVSCTPNCDCTYSTWTDEGECDCDTSMQTQTRLKLLDESGTGTCDNVLTQEVSCTPTDCEPQCKELAQTCTQDSDCCELDNTDEEATCFDAGFMQYCANCAAQGTQEDCTGLRGDCYWVSGVCERHVNPCIGLSKNQCKSHPDCDRKCNWTSEPAPPVITEPTCPHFINNGAKFSGGKKKIKGLNQASIGEQACACKEACAARNDPHFWYYENKMKKGKLKKAKCTCYETTGAFSKLKGGASTDSKFNYAGGLTDAAIADLDDAMN